MRDEEFFLCIESVVYSSATSIRSRNLVVKFGKVFLFYPLQLNSIIVSSDKGSIGKYEIFMVFFNKKIRKKQSFFYAIYC